MNRSGIKRGLAVSAVSALALSGLAVAAQAQTISEAHPANTLVLWSQSTNGISTATDGENTSVTLFASSSEMNDPAAPPPRRSTPSGSSSRTTASGPTSAPSTPPTPTRSPAASRRCSGRTPRASTPRSTTFGCSRWTSTATCCSTTAPVTVNNEVDHSTHEAVSLAGANRDEVGIFNDGATWNTIINGKSTDVGNTDVQVVGPGTASPNDAVDDIGPAVAGVDPWAEVLIVPADNFDLGDAANEIIVRSIRSPVSSDEVQVYTTYVQVPTSVTVVPDPANVNAQAPGNRDPRLLRHGPGPEGQAGRRPRHRRVGAERRRAVLRRGSASPTAAPLTSKVALVVSL